MSDRVAIEKGQKVSISVAFPHYYRGYKAKQSYIETLKKAYPEYRQRLSMQKRFNKSAITAEIRDRQLTERVNRFRSKRYLERLKPDNSKTYRVFAYKWIAAAMILIAILTLNITGELQVERIDTTLIDSTTEVHYSPNYKFIDYDTKYIDRGLAMAKSIEVFGNNTTWISQINEYGPKGGNQVDTLQLIGNIIIMPINLIINLGQLGVNFINAAIGKVSLNSWQLRYVGQITPQGARFTEWVHNLFN